MYNEQPNVQLPQHYDKRLERKKLTLVMSMSDNTGEKDVALDTNFLVLLQLLYSLHAANNYKTESHVQKLLSSPDGIEQIKHDVRRKSSSLATYSNFPLYIVNQMEGGKKFTVNDIYRKDEKSPAKLQPTSESLAQKRLILLDTMYLLKLFWRLEPEMHTKQLLYE